jgi:hypothetical protein
MYACEEARVEMAAVFVCNRLNLPTDFQNHAAYVAGWLKKLREDKRELLSCAADAERIAEYTLSYHPTTHLLRLNLWSRAPPPRWPPALRSLAFHPMCGPQAFYRIFSSVRRPIA